MAKVKSNSKKPIEQYEHRGKKRVNNPPVGLVTPETDQDTGRKRYSYDPHLDPQLVWAGKAERTSFDIPTVSLHVHERIDPRSIIEAVRKKNGRNYEQMSLFAQHGENPPLREAIEFYKHKHNWSNRLIAGDSLLVMNSLIEKEGLAGQVQMVYIDPPYGIKYGSNFQPFVNRREVKDGKDEDLTQEPEMIKAFRDTWELGIHSYLAYLRDRLLLVKELLSESGSIFVQISDENVHLIRNLLDEIFATGNFVSDIAFKKTGGQSSTLLAGVFDHLIWYAKDKQKIKYRPVFKPKVPGEEGAKQYNWLETPDHTRRPMTSREQNGLDAVHGEILQPYPLVSMGRSEGDRPFKWNCRDFRPSPNRHWSVTNEGLGKLASANRLLAIGNTLRFVNFLSDYPVTPLTNMWTDTQTSGFAGDRYYVVQTLPLVIERCLLMTTDPGDLVFDPTCGSGTTSYVSEQWGRRWITCDTSRVAITLAKQRLMTAMFDYFELARPDEGVGSGFRYKTVPHVTLKSIANNESPEEEVLYDQPYLDDSKVRVTGPLTVEAVPAPAVKPLSDVRLEEDQLADDSVSRSGETARQTQWRDELLKAGIRGKGGQRIEFSRLEPLPGTRWLAAEAETKEDKPQRAVISFGPDFAPLEQRQVELAIEEAQTLVPKPKIVIFAAFEFDPEASKDIDETKWAGVTLLKVKMSADLLTDDLKKKRASNETFWLIGQPDVRLEKIKDGKDKGKYRVQVHGFDYYNTLTGKIDSGGTEKIALWMLDTDYDGRSVFPRQVFFPMSGEKDGWSRLAKNLKAEIDEDLIEAYRGTLSLPFEPGDHKRVAVKIVDDRGIESLKVLGF